LQRLHQSFGSKLGRQLTELLQRAPEVVDDLGRQEVGVGEVGGVFEALVAEPKDVEVELVPSHQFVVGKGPPAAVLKACMIFRC